MKKIFLVFLIIMATIPCSAQWKNASMGAQVLAFGVHDTSFFIGINPAGTQAPLIWRLRSVTPNVVWVIADTNIDRSQGNITSFASLGNYLFAGMTYNQDEAGAGWRSSNDGELWSLTAGGDLLSNGLYIYSYFRGQAGIFVSRDSGSITSWDSISNFTVDGLAAIGTSLFAVNAKNVWLSYDAGMHWSTLPAPPISGRMTAMGSLLFIVSSNGKLAVSTDSGSNWSTIPVDNGGVPENVTCLATDGKNLFAGTPMGVLVSTDTGRDWKAENDSLTYKDISAIGVFDTLLFIDVSNIGPSSEFAAYYRPISEMTKPDSPASVVKAAQSNDLISIYPNPAGELVTIIAGNTMIDQIRMLNVLGEEVLSIPYSHASEINLDISKIPSGTYFILIETSTGIVLRKIVKEE